MAKRTKRSDGLYEVKITVNGKRVSVYGKTQSEAKEKAEAKKQELKTGKYIKSDKLTFDQYYERFCDNRRGTVKPSTMRNQNKWYLPISKIVIDNAGTTFGSLKIIEIERQNVIDLQKAMQNAKHKDGSPKYNTTSINTYINLVKHIFNSAVDEEIIFKNPAKSVKALQKVEEKAVNTIHRALSEEETKLFFEAAKESYYYNVFRFLFCSGCRCGEAGGLKYSDINKKENRLEVSRTVTRTEAGGHVVGDSTKTASGTRYIPITEGIRAAIAGQKQTVVDYGLALRFDNLIFTSPEGELLNDTSVNREIARICKRAGIERFTAHAFRDTFATRAIERGMNPKTLQMILGHSDISITMNLYCHVMEETKAKEMNKIAIAL